MNWRIVWAILRKEALDTVRDRRTLVMMLGVPMVLYPALTLLMLQVALVQKSNIDEKDSRVALAKNAPTLLRDWLAPTKRLAFTEPADADAALAKGDLDLVIDAPADFADKLAARQQPKIELRYDATEMQSRAASDRVEEALEAKFKELHAAWLAEAKLSEGQVSPFSFEGKNVASQKKRSGTVLGMTLPALLIIMLAVGAFYPAVDLTAGEKERGTFETLLSTPCSKLEIVTGKFLTVFALSLLTALLNFASMGATLALVLSQVRGAAGDNAAEVPNIQMDLSAVAAVLLILVPLAFLISALMMSIAVFARSFKEANNYMAPFLILIALPATVSTLPGIKLSGVTTLIPITNVVLLFKDLMTGEAGLESVFAVFLSTSIFAGLSLLFAAWLFQREDIVLGGGAAGLVTRRADLRPVPEPTPGLAMTAFFGVLVFIMYLGTLVQQWRIFEGLIVTEYLLILAPCLLLLWYFKIDFTSALLLRRPGPIDFLGALLCGAAGLIFVIQLGAWHNKILPVPQEMQQAFADLFSQGNTPLGLAKLLLVVAVTPAICEEVLFRGVLFSGLRTRMHPAAAVLVVGVLFGVFHLSIYRFASTAALGVVLTYIAWRTGSIFPGAIVHALVNATSILLATEHVPARVVEALHLTTVETDGVWWPLLMVAAAMAALGIGVLEATRFQGLEKDSPT